MLFLPVLMLATIFLPAVHLPTAIVGAEYNSGPIAPGAVLGCKLGMPYFRLVDGVMPEGISLRPGGELVGEPRHGGEYRMTLAVENGCMRGLLPVEVAVRGRAILASFDSEVELSEAKPEALLRISADRPGLAYTAEADQPWLRVRPLRGRTPERGEALTADLVWLEVDRWQLAAMSNPDGPGLPNDKASSKPQKAGRETTVTLSCFRSRSTTVRVVLADGFR